MRQKTGETQGYHTYEKGVEKWSKKHMSRQEKGGISEEGQEILEDRDIWTKETTLRGVIHESRKAVGRMDEVDLGQVTRPKENVTGELSYVPVQRLDSQDYEEKESDR
jgi:hypothetical protein